MAPAQAMSAAPPKRHRVAGYNPWSMSTRPCPQSAARSRRTRGFGLGAIVLAAAWLAGCAARPVEVSEVHLPPHQRPSELARPDDGGPLVRIGRLDVATAHSVQLSPRPHEEIFVVVESGDFGQPFGWSTGAVARVESRMTTSTATPTSLIVAFVRDVGHPFRDDEPHAVADESSWGEVVAADEAPVLSVSDGRLRVQIFHDAANGARFGALSRLDADADLDVPVHVHDSSVEALFIESGDGTMILGDERFAVAPGRVIYVPANVLHGYEHGTQPLRAWQIYAPPGPEQRFRTPPG